MHSHILYLLLKHTSSKEWLIFTTDITLCYYPFFRSTYLKPYIAYKSRGKGFMWKSSISVDSLNKVMLLIDTLDLTSYLSLLLHLILWNLHGHGMFKLLWPCFMLESFECWKKVQSSCFANSNSYKNVFPKWECLEKI